ncbi:SH3 domain-containing protein [uncultured Roseibium sp.]|uniref:SH3 domain-containing protein n=1 Tax=uncultured Roseibium sp. TaxID=1936171 RepID=UPI002612B2D5|nr:SH3 domain-containing protein [uncultured Roseibium sp.]
MPRLICTIAPTMILFVLGTIWPVYVQACADGPDYYDVTDVSENDHLNVRSGPGTGFGVVGVLPPNATALENLDQVPITCDDASNLNQFERGNYWTKIAWKSGNALIVGWVKTKFLTE